MHRWHHTHPQGKLNGGVLAEHHHILLCLALGQLRELGVGEE